ncbi:MAG: hypothetical protein HYZ75_18290 [Elusimicrobia bacterium]|nr:hypothetical protein [Elusimicrobiota bacterium]
MATLHSKIEQEMECPREIVIWNYFDHEHVVGTHYKSYKKIRVYDEKDNWCFAERHFNISYIPFMVVSKNFSHLTSPHTMKSIHIGKLATLVQEYTFRDLPGEKCLVTLESRMEVPWPLGLLQPFFYEMTRKWFYATWDEDVPMRLRRLKVWKLGFKNFEGIGFINDKTPKPAGLPAERPYPIELPVPKSTSVCREGYERPFGESVEVGYGMPPLP